ncbi:MAG: COX15/CtaA family protein [Gammaproteobacteria bacterium]|uniref:Heme A synthase n=1 Tax=SAR86 cluster bacterium TaxID=2030880 RepID=A0A520MYW5_9GAMM|nr:COX15/CtaA family protein [SAR86 cluster bacterium]RZO26415.1 MAG: heme A synthase [SAR86 cluster bacterium]|tara:strand:- start:21633 stop:22616 length:984 start_codon:yes stop_codon:yes gene_type:complete
MNILNTKSFSAIGIAFCFIVIGLGAWTRLADAGLGCPDWPGCYGFVTFPTTVDEIAIAENLYPDSPVEIDKIIPEVVHRYFAASLGLLAIGLLLISLKQKRLRAESAVLLLVIIGQGIFGYLTVSLKLHPLIVTTHLFGAMITTSIFLLIHMKSLKISNGFVLFVKNKPVIIVGFILIIIQLFLGAWTSTNYAARACLDLPYCQGQLVPKTDFSEGFNLFQTVGPNYLFGQMSNEARVAIHLTHRIGAIIVFLYSIFLVFKLWSNETKIILSVFVGTLFTQIFLGVNNVLSQLPLWNAVAHNVVGVVLFLTFVVMTYLSFKGQNEYK